MTDRFVMLGGVLTILALVALLVFATSASAVVPTKAEKRLARAECRAERAGTTYADFASEWGRPRPFRRCVRVTARELARERVVAKREARRACIQEMNADPGEFFLEYGRRHPLRKCIRQEML
jgi:hypothetical protein